MNSESKRSKKAIGSSKPSMDMGPQYKTIRIELSPPRGVIIGQPKHNSVASIFPMSTKSNNFMSNQLSIGMIIPKNGMPKPIKSYFKFKRNSVNENSNFSCIRIGENCLNENTKSNIRSYKNQFQGQKRGKEHIHASIDQRDEPTTKAIVLEPIKMSHDKRVKLPEVKSFNITVKPKDAGSILTTSQTNTNSTVLFPKVTFKENSTVFESEEKEKFPMSAAHLLMHKAKYITSQEQAEVLAYKEIYYYGKKVEKIHSSKMLDYNDGYDEENGDYKFIMHDHICYRYEIISLLGEGSFGKVNS